MFLLGWYNIPHMPSDFVYCPNSDCHSPKVRLEEEGPGWAAYRCEACGQSFNGKVDADGSFQPEGIYR